MSNSRARIPRLIMEVTSVARAGLLESTPTPPVVIATGGSPSAVLRWLSTRPREMALKSVTVNTRPFDGQQPGTSGLRKPVKTFQQPNYTENFVQSIIKYMGHDIAGSTLVIGGDGRFFCRETVLTIIRMCAAHKVRRLVVGQNGLLSTPAASHLIRKLKALGGIILTASHNPGGPDKDFGIKFNVSNGGPAPSSVTHSIYENSMSIKNYKIVPNLQCPLNEVAKFDYEVDNSPVTVEIIDPVADYVALMQEIFDFNSIKNLLQGKGEFKKPFRILVDCMHGVTGPYAKKLFCDIFGAEPSSVLHATPLEDFGGGHPDPNLTYAGGLVQKLRNGEHDFGVAFDGDGDRNMVLGKNAFFVTPSDSLAVLCAHLHCIPYFQKHGIKGFARSMPTAAAIDKVGSATRVSVYEVPTGWKFFGNLLDAGLISVCGEESFGTGSSHIREKDGIWAALTWLSVIAHTNKCVEELLCDHWSTYGRNFTIRHDYEELDSAVANELMKKLEEKIGGLKDVSLVKEPVEYKVSLADNYSYSDLIDKSTVANQGIRILFHNESRIVFRLSGTGSSGATLRVYYEAYVKDVECTRYPREVVLAPLVAIADEVAQITKMTGRQQPTVIT